MNKKYLAITICIQVICFCVMVWLLTQNSVPSVEAHVLYQEATATPTPTPVPPFLGPIYYGEEYVWKVFDHQFPLDYDSVLYPGVMHYDAVIHNPPASEYGYDGHIGIDYSLEYEPVLASADGVVDVADWSNSANHRLGYGLHVVMSHDANADYTTIYGHLSTMNVETGDVIEIDLNDPGNRDRIIGISGNTGHVFNDANNDCAPIPISGANCGQHLHFETRRNGVVVNPYGWISSTPDPWALHEDGTVSHYLWANQPAALSTQYINSGPSGTQIVEPAVNNARMIIDDASADFSHYLQQPHEGESGLPPIPPECGQIVPNEDAYNGSYRQISANTFPMCQSYWHIRPDAFTSPGAYDVFVHIPPGDNKSLGAEYTVRHNGRYLLIQYNCEAALFAVLQNVQTGKETTLARGYFLDWSPDGEWLLFRQTDEDAIWLVQVTTGSRQTLLNLPPGVYNAAFRFDGQTVVTASSHGLGFGSELGGYNLAASAYTPWQTFPQQVIAYPRWSPDGTKLAYILMPDSNQPFTEGELWLADPTTGAPSQKLDSVDAGHGYSPEWSPDGRSLAYVRRENPDSVRANHIATALHSNVYLADAASGQTTPLTTFPDSLVYDITWSPDGAQMAFTADDAIWLMQPGQTPVQLTQNETSRHPAWIVENN